MLILLNPDKIKTNFINSQKVYCKKLEEGYLGRINLRNSIVAYMQIGTENLFFEWVEVRKIALEFQ